MVINSHNKKILQTCLFVLVAIVVLGIGYASISAINLIVNGNATASVDQNNFKVHFIEAKAITGITGVGGTSVIESDDTKTSFSVTGLSKVGDYAEAKYVVKNDSNGIGAEITLELTNSNSEYFKVTETIDDNKLQAGEETYATVKVEMLKTPTSDDVSTIVTATLIATPLENTSATGGGPASKIAGNPESFATDSWSTIKKAVQDNNTSAYNVGDTKTVTINNTDYTVRIANKTTGEHCGDENTSYSQTACGFVVEFADVVEKRAMNSTATNVGGWPGSELYTYLQGTFYNSLPSDLKNVIKRTRVISGHGSREYANFTSTDNLYLLSSVEVFGADEYDTAAGTTHQLEYYQGMEAGTTSWGAEYYSRTYKKYNGSSCDWRLRSAVSRNYLDFSYVGSGCLSVIDADKYYLGVSPAFRIG